MTSKELKHLRRSELLEMLIAQMEENEKQGKLLEGAENALRSRQIDIENAGSIAEASLQLNGVFEAAQSAAEQYLENVRRMEEQQNLIAQQMQEKAKKQADFMIAQADTYSRETRREADAYWQQVSERVRALHQDPENLQQIPCREKDHT